MNAESELIGCILAGADPTDTGVQPADFDDPVHRVTWEACIVVAESGRQCGIQAVAAELQAIAADRKVRLDGDPGLWLFDLAQSAVSVNAPAFAEKVRIASANRGLLQVAERIRSAASSDADPEETIETARAMLDQHIRSDAATRTMADLLPPWIDALQDTTPPGLTTPWPDLDRFLQGLHRGRLYVVGGRPGAGKSVVLTNLAAHWASVHGQHVLFSTIEMPAPELVTRIAAATARIHQSNLNPARVTERDWQAISEHEGRLRSMPLHICDDAQQTVTAIRSRARTIARRHGIGLVVVDYLQLIATSQRSGLSRQQALGEVTRALKRLAKELDVPVVTAAQLKRPPDRSNSSPGLADLRESGDIEADADAVVLLHNPEPENIWELHATVAKNRSGARGECELFFDASRALIRSVQAA